MGGPPNVAALITNQIEVSAVLVTLEGLNADIKKPGVAIYVAMHSQNQTYKMEQFVVRNGLNVTSLKEYDFFTYAKVNGRKVKFVEPTDYYLEYKDSVMTLHFMLPLAKPAQVKTLDFEVFDPTYFVDFALAEKDPATLSGAPADCTLAVKGPQQASQPNVQRLPDAMANQPETMNFGAQYANKISVKCP